MKKKIVTSPDVQFLWGNEFGSDADPLPPPPAFSDLHCHAQRCGGHRGTGCGSGRRADGGAYGTVQPDPDGAVSIRTSRDRMILIIRCTSTVLRI